MATLPDSYIPPIVSILPDLASNTSDIQDVVDGTGHSVETLFENRLARAFQMIGFEVDEMGQGSGRNPDGIAKDHMHNYAIIYDAKSRINGYSMGTSDERQFQDYINREVPSLRAQGFRNVYFAVISGDFTDDGRDAIRTLKISTDIQEVRLIEVEALLILLENRLRDPSFGLGPGDLGGPGVQDFFAESGVLTAADMREELGV
ncbi:restriction endonuclease FokI C-terminal domain-containing protein [Halorubrum sp. DTA46]|uniref:restriction endonuclease FokI C-terminal domain-containing protein n=1 Tax=Halorubrum sp. DTA46 TaxID=3402162 RepID=UPI003AB08B40